MLGDEPRHGGAEDQNGDEGVAICLAEAAQSSLFWPILPPEKRKESYDGSRRRERLCAAKVMGCASPLLA